MTAHLQPGIDISHHDYDRGSTQQKADWDLLDTRGIGFVIAKALETGNGIGYHPSGYPIGTDPAWGWHKKQMQRLEGSIQKGAYCWLQNDGNEDEQADTFLGLLDDAHDPTGWLCALDVEGADNFGLPAPGYNSVKRFAKEFWRQAPGQPLLLYTRKTYWDHVSPDGDAKALGMTLWTATYTKNLVSGATLGTIASSDFDANAPKISFGYTDKTPYSGGYAGFTGSKASSIIQWGPMKVAGVGTFDGDAFNGTTTQLRALSQPLEPVHAVTWKPSTWNIDVAIVANPTQFGTAGGPTLTWSVTGPLGLTVQTVVSGFEMGSHAPQAYATVDGGSSYALVS